MTKSEAVSEVFITAFRSLSRREKLSVLEKLLADKKFGEDTADSILAWRRRKEKSIPYQHVRNELKKAGRL